ncbi:MAG: HPr family phosphocarrier protein [Collinsella sp.]
MVEFTKTIKDPLGLHARPVALLYDIIAKHRSDVSVSIGDRHTDGRDVMGLMATLRRVWRGHHLPRFGRG